MSKGSKNDDIESQDKSKKKKKAKDDSSSDESALEGGFDEIYDNPHTKTVKSLDSYVWMKLHQ